MHAYCPLALQFGPDTLARLMDKVAPAKLDEPTGPDRFSPRQVAAHLRFFEPVCLGRMKAAFAESGQTVEDWDEEADVARNNYDELEVGSLVAVWRQNRAETIAFLEALAPAAWACHVVHPSRGTMTIEDMANMLIAHDMYHVSQIVEVLG